MERAIKKPTPKERILKTVDRLFYEQGYLATGINQIIAEAKVAKASFYQHFPSKEALVLKYIEAHNIEFFQKLRQLEKQSSEPKATILALFDFLAEIAQKSECRGCSFMNIAVEFSDSECQARQLIAQFKTDFRLYVEQLVKEALTEDISRESAQIKATAVYLLFEAASIESRVHRDIWPIKASKDAVIELLD